MVGGVKRDTRESRKMEGSVGKGNQLRRVLFTDEDGLDKQSLSHTLCEE